MNEEKKLFQCQICGREYERAEGTCDCGADLTIYGKWILEEPGPEPPEPDPSEPETPEPESPEPEPPETQPPEPDPPKPKQPRTGWKYLLAGAVVAVGVLGVLGLFLAGVQQGKKSEVPPVSDEKEDESSREADAETPEECYQLGRAYEYGIEVDQDYTEAAKWYEKAAEQGDMSAQEKLIQCYRNGKGVEKDERKAVEWISRLNDQQYKKTKEMQEKLEQEE